MNVDVCLTGTLIKLALNLVMVLICLMCITTISAGCVMLWILIKEWWQSR